MWVCIAAGGETSAVRRGHGQFGGRAMGAAGRRRSTDAAVARRRGSGLSTFRWLSHASDAIGAVAAEGASITCDSKCGGNLHDRRRARHTAPARSRVSGLGTRFGRRPSVVPPGVKMLVRRTSYLVQTERQFLAWCAGQPLWKLKCFRARVSNWADALVLPHCGDHFSEKADRQGKRNIPVMHPVSTRKAATARLVRAYGLRLAELSAY
jgi:hypothetical protein